MRNTFKLIVLLTFTLGAFARAETLDIKELFPDKAKTDKSFSEALRGLESCVKHCVADEAKIASREITIMKAVKAGTESYDSILEKSVALSSDLIDLYTAKADRSSLFVIYGSSLGTLASAKNKFPEFRKKIAAGITELPKKYPNEPKAFSLYGGYLALNGGDNLDVIQAYKQCLNLDSKNQSCRKVYDSRVAAYTQPRCYGRDLGAKSFGFYLASDSKAQGLVERAAEKGQTYYTEPKPDIEPSDVDEITASTGMYGEENVTLHFTEAGQKKMAALTRENIGKTLAVVVDGKVITAPVIKSEVSEGAQISSGGVDTRSRFAQICPNPKKPELPHELKL